MVRFQPFPYNPGAYLTDVVGFNLCKSGKKENRWSGVTCTKTYNWRCRLRILFLLDPSPGSHFTGSDHPYLLHVYFSPLAADSLVQLYQILFYENNFSGEMPLKPRSVRPTEYLLITDGGEICFHIQSCRSKATRR